ncbi:D-alanyl-D-alanine carboxypeptidase [Streptomyces leeuwenhoekii]|uniref:D-alanyl-D-alanine carboxypeptidase n=1 Tax=Streptomyces leeuwenhoekii TaxID=1437453 RepID=UPI000997C259|nr:D-alanyl-D-alanine carboxypeptidase [Streptomyces leeuwenhoekii]
MEEASVAGESPDKSKQRESSARPTSGSAGPVPEARSGSGDTRKARDPRAAAARDTASSESSESAAASDTSASSAASASGGAADTATKVLPVAEPGTEGTAAGGGKAGAEGFAASADRGAGAPGEGRLRNAVAAWVASADKPASSGSSGSEDAGKDSGKDSAKAEDAEDAEKAGTGEKTAGKAPETPGKAGEAGKAAQGAGTGAGAARKAGGTDTDTGKDTGAPEDEGDRADASTPATGEAADATDAGTDADDGTDTEGDSDADDATDTDGDSDPAAKESGERPVDQPTAVFKAVRPPAPAVDQPTTMLKLGGTATGPKWAEKTEKTDKAENAGNAGKTDKTDKADKTGAADKAAPPKKEGSKAGAESDAERTSKFVALKPLDDPATRKAPGTGAGAAAPAAEATTALPRVPADATASVPQVGPERTTQQPLPPKPPLDLLAELTNTPPPPPTPLRTLARRVKIWTPLVLLLVIVFAVVQSMRPLPSPELDLTAKDSYTFEGGKAGIPWPSDGQAALDVQGIGTFGSSGEQKPVPIASVAKVMTAYLILRDHPLGSGEEGPQIEIDQAAQDQGIAESDESKVKVYKGDKISQREALEGVLIASANNVARLLARWDAGSEKAFVQKMNDAAEDLGMTNTTYTDPSGLNNTTVSTAVDQVKLAKEAMKSPAFREVAAMMSYEDYKGVTHPNWNQLVGFNGVVGIKTGTTSSALGNLVFAAKKEVGGETRTIVGAVVRQPPGGADNSILAGALSAGDKLIRAAQGALESRTILKKGDVVGYVDDGLGGRTPVVATQDVKAVGWSGLTVKLTFAADDIPHTAEAGTKVGTLTVGDGGVSGAVKVPVALQEDLVEPGFTDKLTRVG